MNNPSTDLGDHLIIMSQLQGGEPIITLAARTLPELAALSRRPLSELQQLFGNRQAQCYYVTGEFERNESADSFRGVTVNLGSFWSEDAWRYAHNVAMDRHFKIHDVRYN